VTHSHHEGFECVRLAWQRVLHEPSIDADCPRCIHGPHTVYSLNALHLHALLLARAFLFLVCPVLGPTHAACRTCHPSCPLQQPGLCICANRCWLPPCGTSFQRMHQLLWHIIGLWPCRAGRPCVMATVHVQLCTESCATQFLGSHGSLLRGN
jgi:hypothetical protein